MRMDAWVTSAVEEKDVNKTIVLAGSLRRVCTAKGLVVFTAFSVALELRKKLKKAFDLVIPLEQDIIPNGLSLADHAKIEAFSLGTFNKCVYLSPNTLVLKNCDDIFDKYYNFAAWESEEGVDLSVYVFIPSEEIGEALTKIARSEQPAMDIKHGKGQGHFAKSFQLWIRNNIPNWERLDGQYNFALDLKNGTSKNLTGNVSIVNFVNAHPLDMFAEGNDGNLRGLGLIEMCAVEFWRNIFMEDVDTKPNMQDQAPSCHPTNEPIAVIGMSFRLPGGNNVEEFWDLLASGKEAIKFLPDNRWTRAQTYLPCKNRKVEGGFLEVPVDEFDAKFFKISGKEAEFLDPQQRLLHEVAWEALEDAMIDPLSLRGTQTGIFVGSWLHDYQDMLSTTPDVEFFRAYMGNSIGAGPARLSHFFETTGPSIGTESGCSSAIVAVDMACKSLRNRDSNMALACGVNLILHPFDNGLLSFVVAQNGRCKTFDEGADGFGRAEGCAVLLLKRLSDAVRDDDNIWGLIRGSAVTQEGVSKSLGTPTVHCESLAMELAMKDAGVNPVEISYVEAHGTGTPVGDPLEIAAITKAYSKGRSEPLVIGSVKTNVGHTESVSGITGIIKVLLSMKYEIIPKHLNLRKLNPAIDLDVIPAIIPMKALPWVQQSGKPRIAGVSSFGITGGDGHVIIQEPHIVSPPQFHSNIERPLYIMKLSAKSPESFEALLETYERLLTSNDSVDAFGDIAYSANIGRATFNHRAVIIANTSTEAAKIIRDKTYKHAEVQSSSRRLCFLFTGQGSQYPNMAANLYSTSPIFRDYFDKCDKLLSSRYDINIREVLWGQPNDGMELSRTLYSQTSIFCIEYCLLKLWESWGVKPDYVMGHSLGEFAAAVAVGRLDFEDALMLVAERSRLIDSLPGGSMLVIKADKETVHQKMEIFKSIKPNFMVDYAALNSPDQTVVAGDSEMIAEFAKFCGENSLKTILLAATHAFHSSHMDHILDSYRQVAQNVKPRQVGKDSPKYISGMEGKLIDLEHIDADYWVRHTREPVRFMDACKVAQSEGCSLFLEIGPQPVLSALTMMNSEGHSITCLPSIKRKEDEWVTMLDSLTKLYLSDWKGEVDWRGFDRYYKRSRVSLPFYPFNRKPIWKEMESALPCIHPLLGKAVRTECDHSIFKKILILKNNSFVQDHVIGNTVVFPGAGFLEMCIAGGHAALQGISDGDLQSPTRPVVLKSLKISAPLALSESGTCRLQTVTKLDMEDKDEVGYSVGVHRYDPFSSDKWITHATAKFIPVPHLRTVKDRPDDLIDIPAIQQSWEATDNDNKNFYEKLPEAGLHFGPQFKSIGMGWKSETGMLVSIKVPEDNSNYLIHPVVADAMLQAIMLWTSKGKWDNGAKMKLQVPVQIGEFTWLQSSPSAIRYIYCSTTEDGKTEAILLDDQCSRLASMSGVDFMETSVKVVEGLILQQGTAMPKLWKEVWKSNPGPLQSSYMLKADHKDDPLLQSDGETVKQMIKLNDIGDYERSFSENLCSLARFFFVNAMYELGWKPVQGTPFTFQGLISKLLPDAKEHQRRYCRFFLRALADAGMTVADPEVEDMYHFRSPPPTQNELEKSMSTMVRPEDSTRADHQVSVMIGRNLSKFLLGVIDPVEFLFSDDPSKPNISNIYKALTGRLIPSYTILNNEILGKIVKRHERNFETGQMKEAFPPVLRILEIGAGTGTFTKPFLEMLEPRGLPYQYHFTDVSASFFIAAEKVFEAQLGNMVFKKLNMEEDPLAQGFSPHYFDVILACEALHVAKDIRKTLRNIQCLLKPGGVFQIVETTVQDLRATQVFGLLEGYWQFEDLDFRPYHVTLTPEKWEVALREINCGEVHCIPLYNSVHSCIVAQLSSSVTATPLPSIRSSQYSWLIFCHEPTLTLAELLKEKLIGVNRKVKSVHRPAICSEDNIREIMRSQVELAKADVGELEGVIYLWGISDDGDANRDQSKISLPVINLVQEIMGNNVSVATRVYLVTQGAAYLEGCSQVTQPAAATLHGLMKSLTNELAGLLHTNCWDLCPDTPVGNQVDELFYNLWGTDKLNTNIAFRDDKRLSNKLISARAGNNEPLSLPSGYNRFQLVLPTTRLISDLEFGVLESYILEGDEVEVEVKAMALNFRDVFAVLKPIEQFEDLNTVGLEFAGVVTKLGSNVTSLNVGDRVLGINMDKNLSLPSHIKMKGEALVQLSSSTTFAEGVTLPTGFLTAFHCLIEVAGMKRGETVLIHTASGGVGLCAIQLAKQVGTEIIATAGSQRKRNYLRNLGIKHVFHSRTTDFGKRILEVSNGRGVDIVLNSLTGEGFKEASLTALAKNGRFIEMSKLNVWTPEEVKMLRTDAFYAIVDLSSMEAPVMQKLLEKLRNFMDSGSLLPIAYELFDCVNIRGALNYLQRAKHIGKIVCVMPEIKFENAKIIATTPLFNEFSTYLVTGGLGGIGFEVVKWMLRSGAKHIAIASRSQPKPGIASQIESWNKNGKHVEAFPVDIGDYNQCQKLFQQLESPTGLFPPVRGVMHVAGVLADAILENQTWDKFRHTYNPKVNGTWNLHDLTKDMLLEHFVLFSSMAAVVGSPGQSNHSASNSFEDSLAAYRRSNGLPGITVNWGNWGEVGVATEMDFAGFRPITTSQGILALETFLRTQSSHMFVTNVDSFAMALSFLPSLRHYVEDKRLLGEVKTSTSINCDELWKNYDNAEDRQGKLPIIKEFIKSTLKGILKMEEHEVIDDLVEFQSLGVDSLMMLELKNGMQNVLGSRLTINATQLKDCNNTEVLANRLVDMIEGEEEDSPKLPTVEELHQLMRADSILPEHIRPREGMIKKGESEIETILLTGATGVLGPYLLKELSQRPTIKKIVCLIRKREKVTATERLLKRLKVVNLENQVDMTKVECIEGDITDDKFGLSDTEYLSLAGNIDAIVNSAVRVDHTAKYYKAPVFFRSKNDVRSINVKGTIRILEFATHSKLKHVYHAATYASVFSTDEHGCLLEEWQDPGVFEKFSFNFGYLLSKHISEQLCRQAGERGIPTKTFRLSSLGGDSRTGRFDYLNNHMALRWLAYLKLRCMPDLLTPLILIPVDHCARISLDLFFDPRAPSADVYNIFPPQGGIDQTFIEIAEEFGTTIELVSFSEFVGKLKLEKDDSPLALFKKLYEDEMGTLLENLKDNSPTFHLYQKYLENSSNFFRSRKLPQLIPDYDELESTEVVMRRDIQYLKESGVFEKFGIKYQRK